MSNQSKTVQFINLIKRNQTAFFTMLGFLCGIIVLIVFFNLRMQMINSSISDRIVVATKHLMNNQTEEGIAMLDEIIEKYPSKPAAFRAMLMRANNLYSKKEYEQAKAMAENIVNNAKPASVRLLAYPLIIAINEEMNNVQQAIELSKKFLSLNPEHFLAPSVMENLARLYEVSENIEESQKFYKQVKEKYPDTVYSQRAETKITEEK